VRLLAESLERGRVPEAPKQQEYFRFMVQECRRLSAVIENALDFSRIEQGRKEYDFEPTDLVALARQTVKLMETYAAERPVALALTIPDPELPALTSKPVLDGKAIQQALVNLIDNAIKHSPKGETVTVGLEADAASETGARPLRLWVEDHGPGIPPEEHARIFERFYRLGSELRRETQGVGIGLSIVKHVVEAHEGRVVVRSAPGQGSRFTICLP
jgi:signal transduction histidine kinase